MAVQVPRHQRQLDFDSLPLRRTLGVSRQLSVALTIRVITALSQLHDNVQQSRLALLFPRSTCGQFTPHCPLTIDRIDIFLQQHSVPLPLHLCHSDIQVDLLFGQERVLHIRLDSSKQEWSQHLVQLLDHSIGLRCIFRLEPLVKVLAAVSSPASDDSP